MVQYDFNKVYMYVGETTCKKVEVGCRYRVLFYILKNQDYPLKVFTNLESMIKTKL